MKFAFLIKQKDIENFVQNSKIMIKTFHCTQHKRSILISLKIIWKLIQNMTFYVMNKFWISKIIHWIWVTPLKYKRISSVQFDKGMVKRTVNVQDRWWNEIMWGPGAAWSVRNCHCILILFSHRNSEPHPRISLIDKSLKCSLIQVLYLHLEYF